MVAQISTVAFQGIEARTIEVQVQIAGGMPAFTIVGLPDKAVSEAKERVRAALIAIGLSLPPERITVNLSPADIPKEGSHFDLPIAVGLLVALGVISDEDVVGHIVMGELGLDGSLRAVTGTLPAAIHANSLDMGLICPHASGSEAAWAGQLDIWAPKNLLALINHIKGSQILTAPEPCMTLDESFQPDLIDIKGQEVAKRALEVTAAGGHNLLMVGPPGSGKSMLAARLPGILPPMSPEEALETSMVASLAGELLDGKLTRNRPFRNPHHSASMPALIGGGSKARPGEVSLANNGVLFLDELPEFARPTLEALRQPLESGRAVIARAMAHVSYPARFQLIAAMNPCKCGYLDDASLACNRAPRCAADYQTKISGPLYDRIDIHMDVPAVSAADLTLPPPAEGSKAVALRVAHARQLQLDRFADIAPGRNVYCNALADGKLLEDVAAPSKAGRKLLNTAIENMKLSARGYHRVLKVGRTLADMASDENVQEHHIAEALSYRRISPQLQSSFMKSA